MNQLLMLLLMLAQQQRQRAAQGQAIGGPQPGAGQRAGGGDPMNPSSGSRYSPQGFQGLQWLNQNYWNPSRTGASTQPGGGNVWEGFTRGSNPDPRRNQAVGMIGAMRGGMPNPRESGFESLNRNVGGPPGMNTLGTWLGDIYSRENAQANTPLRDARGSDPLFGDAPRFGGGAGDVWKDFFSRGSSLENMDKALRGEGLGGGAGGSGYMWLV